MTFAVGKWIKDICFPIFCVSCSTEGVWWCAECRSQFKNSYTPSCLGCHAEGFSGTACPACQSTSSLDKITALYAYHESTAIGQLIHAYKYRSASDVGWLWQELLAFPSLPEKGVLIPVPLHPRRQRERGYNQALLIARILASKQKIAFREGDLVRVRYTAQQATLDRAGRLRNTQGAFIWRGAIPAHCVLVDDVYTTGSTMQECARVLKEAGAQYVEGVVIARG